MTLLAQALQGTDYTGGYSFTLPSQIESVANLFNGITYGHPLILLVINLLLVVVVLLTLFYCVFAGFKFVTSQGDKKAVEEARTGLTYAIIGLVIAMMSFLIVNLVLGFFQQPLLGGS